MKTVHVRPSAVPTAWPHVEGWIVEALRKAHADLSPHQVRHFLERGTMQLWLAWDGKPVGCWITELIESVRGRTCNVVVLAGDRLDDWTHLEADMVKWAREWQCTRFALTGRRGWVRRLAGDGWTETAVTLEKVIDNGHQQQPNAKDANGAVGASATLSEASA